MRRIVCIGNRYFGVGFDDVGPRVYDALANRLPQGVEVIDGGLAGLGLLRWFDAAGCLVFVDTVSGFGPAGSVHVLEAEHGSHRGPEAATTTRRGYPIC